MWYEVLPSVALLGTFLALPGMIVTTVHKINNGGKEKRVALHPYQWYLMERDRRLSGVNKYFESKGLENIDD
ncbi:NADH dehydrogenase [ubiquinone] 1 alpha subcomplex subunit 1 [Carettochelys insculpta]|uniref:NADH dehydrogenase [ubiquinone] 1 alpha subcomplex subunit 1 n=1 Tax=Carettochelys insculpta TaxID=44489 RepID=UPI003EBE43BF